MIGQKGSQYPAIGFSVIGGPHVLYYPPPSIGLGDWRLWVHWLLQFDWIWYRRRAAGRTSDRCRGERPVYHLRTDHRTA
jgi:hypothetical protein